MFAFALFFGSLFFGFSPPFSLFTPHSSSLLLTPMEPTALALALARPAADAAIHPAFAMLTRATSRAVIEPHRLRRIVWPESPQERTRRRRMERRRQDERRKQHSPPASKKGAKQKRGPHASKGGSEGATRAAAANARAPLRGARPAQDEDDARGVEAAREV